jgi:hypothetical protein
MPRPPEDIEARVSLYATHRDVVLEHRLGQGKDGIVFQTDVSTAVKVFHRRESYSRELACYQRFAHDQVEEIHGHAVPCLIAWDDELLVIEMEIVSPPYLIDFADCYLDAVPDFPDEVIEQWHEEKREQFGDRWEEVQLMLAFLRGQYGIHLLDVNPDNIRFV